jgi:predicted dehydrogenase
MGKIIICGLGLIGKQRYSALVEAGYSSENILVYDPNLSTLSKSRDFIQIDMKEFESDIDVERVIVSTPHFYSADIAGRFLDFGAKVLMEKPMGRNLAEAKQLYQNINSKNLSIGFNYRFMPAVQILRQEIQNNSLGEIHTIRLELGHGGSPSDRKSWKLNPVAAGGGALLDPGIHLLDLMGYIFGCNVENTQIAGALDWKGFWLTGIEETVSAIGYFNSTIVNFHVSLVSWKTRFEIEVIGTDGYFRISGRGRSDGPQIITKGKRWGWQTSTSQEDSEERIVLATEDKSIKVETIAWLNNSLEVANAEDGMAAESLRYAIERKKVL